MKFAALVENKEYKVERAKKIYMALRKGIFNFETQQEFDSVFFDYEGPRIHKLEYILPEDNSFVYSKISQSSALHLLDKDVQYFIISKNGEKTPLVNIPNITKMKLRSLIVQKFKNFDISIVFYSTPHAMNENIIDDKEKALIEKENALLLRAKTIFKGLKKGFLNFGQAHDGERRMTDNENGEFIVKYELPEISSMYVGELNNPGSKDTVFIRLLQSDLKLITTIYFKHETVETEIQDKLDHETIIYYTDWIRKNFLKFNIYITWLDSPL